MTNRESTENSIFHSNINAIQSGGYQTITNVNKPNVRDTTNVSYVGNGKSSYSEPRLYDAEYATPMNNIKSTTINSRLIPGNMKLNHANNNIQIHNNKDESLLYNNRSLVQKMPIIQCPDISNMGTVQGINDSYSIQTDRNLGLLNQLETNEYHIPLLSK
jgi:hypothetical protein